MAVLITAAPRLAEGDGGIIRLRQTQGPFEVTVFETPEATAGEATDVSMLIQDTATGNVVLDAAVSFTPSPPRGARVKPPPASCCRLGVAAALSDGISNPPSVRATREQASNKLLYAASLELNPPGNWPLHILVSRGADVARFDLVLPVTAKSGKLAGLWPFLAFPPLAAAAFVLNQWLRFRSLQRWRPARPIV